jgi:sec-independent protein translocase protein TatA
MFGGLGLYELCIIFAIAVIIFGPSRLPKLGRAAAETIREFRGVGREIERGDEAA